MSQTKKLWTSLYTILHRRILPSSSRLQFHCASSRTVSTSFHQPNFSARVLFDNIGNGLEVSSSIFGKSFCSQHSGGFGVKCWQCNALPETLPFLVCESCRTIQPVDHSINYFQIFGLEKKYDVEGENLESKYKNWQKKLHPDLVHSKSEKEREFAAEQSARVIDAYRTLSNRLLKAIYILKLEGVDVDEEETVSEPELLTEIMEIREAVEEAADLQELKKIQSQMQEKLKYWSGSFANAFRCQKFEEAVECIRRMTYYDRVNKEIVKRL
ncbi:iron-sulfur cluster co-chaperone protein HscB homolog [Tripterygium wilfordii]|uniref:iron-sulfur cluster co-chaperone protein HscB homolog n=1 Tax=Tripterygium wilfordii TaxID=458696 RepID=UPI0018F8155E|nr:iron-sulfur cluster co-chaperone protein HscB homolog [Tripterygium wilfordii]